ncbi:hypothetical protein Mro03_38520 [Microbispora rosea subsp. rosea]|nr:hypothetical protein Mro03_38520 [Microbispora rosea subsp. rosea]
MIDGSSPPDAEGREPARVFIDPGRGDGCRRNRSNRANHRIQGVDMTGYLPYRDSTPAARIGGVRGWQADILRGES